MLKPEGSPLRFATAKDTVQAQMAKEGVWKVMVVDDDPSVHDLTHVLLAEYKILGKRIKGISAYSATEAKDLIAQHPDTAVMLLDVVMEENDSGLQVVRHVRKILDNQLVRIILRTGQPGLAPEKELFERYDINDYKTKTELTEDKFFTTLLASLRAYEGLIKLDRTRSHLRDIINSMPSILVGIDPEQKVNQWNHQAELFTGFTEPQAFGQALGKVFPQLTSHIVAIDTCLNKGEIQTLEKVPWQVGNEVRHFDLMLYPLVNREVEGAVCVITDVTIRIRLEEMMIQSEKMMSVGGLAAGMAHEVNNPLSGILQGLQNTKRRLSVDLNKNLEVAEELSLDLSKVNRYLEERGILRFLEGIEESAQRAANIVANMLRFSRKSASQKSSADLSELINKTLELASNDYDLKKRYDFRHIQVHRQFDPEIEMVPCEITEIQQVFLNLFKNAAQAMFEQNPRNTAPTLRVQTKKDGDWAEIRVSDNGPGMDELTKKRIFEPFFTTKEVGQGTGLGLAVSYFIVTNNHRGSFEVDSSPGEGTTFIVKLPLSWKAG